MLLTSCRDVRATVGMEVRCGWADKGAQALETVLACSHPEECTWPPLPQHTGTQEKGSPSRTQPLSPPKSPAELGWGGSLSMQAPGDLCGDGWGQRPC